MSAISQKIRKNIENITELKQKIFSWRELDQEHLFSAIKEFEKAPRREVAVYYNDLFNDPKLAKTLLDIYSSHKDNTNLTVLIVSTIGNILQRYNLPETDEIYSFMLENAYKKYVGPYVAIFLPRMEHFAEYSDRWKYFMDVKEMAPRKVAHSSFETIIDLFYNKIPKEYKNEAKDYFLKKSEEADNQYGKKYYSDIAEKIR